MTKRFTPKASTYTERLAEIQDKQSKLRAQLTALDAEEQGLKAFLMPFYNEGKTEVSVLDGTLLVNFSSTDREYLNQRKVTALLAKLGKKVPTFTTQVVSFKVVRSK